MRRFCLVMLVLAVAACGGARNATDHPSHTRTTLLVLYQKKGSNDCRIRGASEIRGYNKDRFEWQVANYCDSPHTVEVKFKDPTPGSDTHLTDSVAAGLDGTLYLVADREGHFPYSLVVDTVPQVDPRLEIDPFSK